MKLKFKNSKMKFGKLFILAIFFATTIACTKKFKKEVAPSIKINCKHKKTASMILDIGYKTFKKDCREIIGKPLKKYGFEELSKYTTDYEMTFQNKFCQIENSMIYNFPWVNASFCFKFKDRELDLNLIDEFLEVDKKNSNELYEKYFNEKYEEQELSEKFKTEILYNIKILESDYISLLNNDFFKKIDQNKIEEKIKEREEKIKENEDEIKEIKNYLNFLKKEIVFS